MKQWFAIALWCVSGVSRAAGQACPADDYNQHESLALPPDLQTIVGASDGDWSATTRRIDALREHAAEEAERTSFMPLSELALTLHQILDDYDGTVATAKHLRLAELKPVTCPSEDGFPICAWEVLGTRVRVPNDTSDGFSCERKTLLASYLLAARKLVGRIEEPALRKAARDLSQFAAQWTRYVGNGYSQYPHEVLLNGWLFLDAESWTPPRNQLIALHPAVGFGTLNITESARSAALVLAVETLGYVRYLRDFRHHLGVSLAVAFPNFERDAIGLGPVLHFDGFGIGYSINPKAAQPDTVFVLLDVTRSIDDYALVQKAGGWIRERISP
ncbi:MAG TPA: hypothetical protein VI299_08080 [Polyangiales bacterium]